MHVSKSAIKRMKKMYGENQKVTGNYDEALAAHCENGTFIGREKEGVLSYKGIPFALPPVGERRWKAPAPVTKSNDVYEAYYFGKSPIQEPWPTELASLYPTSEDCLYLNVWTSSDRSVKKPVMVFIHGGAYGYGGTSDPLYDGHNFIKSHPDVVLVTIAYRVGIMGFVDFSSVRGSKGYEDSTNLGILDQIEALRFINRNIASFGGDNTNVTLFGESAGGGSVSILPVLDEAKGLFSRVIAQSGSIALTYSKKEAKLFTRLLLKETGAKNMQDLLNLTEEELYKANLPINEKNNFPIRDGRIIPKDLYKAYEEGKSAGIDMMAGTNKDECRYWIGEMGGIGNYAAGIPALFESQCSRFSKEDVKAAREYFFHGQGAVHWRLTEFENDLTFRVPAEKQLWMHAKTGAKTYHYFWTEESTRPHYKACHAVELSSIFNNLRETVYTGTPMDPALAKEAQDMWVNFAKTGDPSTEANPWPLYTEDNRKTMVLGKEIFIKDNLLSRRTAIVEKLLRYQINGNYADLSFNVPYVWVAVGGAILFVGILITLLLLFIL